MNVMVIHARHTGALVILHQKVLCCCVFTAQLFTAIAGLAHTYEI